MARLMDLLKVVRLREVGVEELEQEGLPEIQELVLLVVCRDVRFVRFEVLGWDPVLINNPSVGSQPPNDKLVEHVICRVGVVVLGGILHDFTDVLSSILEDEVVTSGMIYEELRHVIDLSITSDPAAFGDACSSTSSEVKMRIRFVGDIDGRAAVRESGGMPNVIDRLRTSAWYDLNLCKPVTRATRRTGSSSNRVDCPSAVHRTPGVLSQTTGVVPVAYTRLHVSCSSRRK
jgi:hypothetical protein